MQSAILLRFIHLMEMKIEKTIADFMKDAVKIEKSGEKVVLKRKIAYKLFFAGVKLLKKNVQRIKKKRANIRWEKFE